MRNQLENETPMALCTIDTRNRSARLGSARFARFARFGLALRLSARLASSARKLGSALVVFTMCIWRDQAYTGCLYIGPITGCDATFPFTGPPDIGMYNGCLSWKSRFSLAGRIGRDGAPPTGYVPAGASVHDSYTVGI